MLKNPYINALLAGLYIVSLVSIVNQTAHMFPGVDSIFAPMIMLSLLVISVIVMGFLFIYKPAQLFIDGHKRDAVTFLGKSLATFVGFVVVLIILLVATSAL